MGKDMQASSTSMNIEESSMGRNIGDTTTSCSDIEVSSINPDVGESRTRNGINRSNMSSTVVESNEALEETNALIQQLIDFQGSDAESTSKMLY